MCEMACSAWYPSKVHGQVVAMPCSAVTHQCEHREREPNPFTAKHLPRALVAAADSDADSERDGARRCSEKVEAGREAATLEHQALHSKKNNQCDIALGVGC